MLIYHAEDGSILYTTTIAAGAKAPAGTYIEVPDGTTVDLQKHHVVGGELVARTVLTEVQRQMRLSGSPR